MNLNLWEDIIQLLEGNMSAAAITLWIAPLRLLFVSEEKIILEAPARIHQRIVEERYVKAIQRCARALCGRPMKIEFVLADEEKAPPSEADHFRSPRRSVTNPSPALNRNYTFRNFVVGRCNSAAYRAAFSVAQGSSGRQNPLFIAGRVGLGKTHLLQAIAACMLRRSERSFLYTPTDKLMDDLMGAFAGGSVARLEKRLAAANSLLIDDIHFLSGRDRVQEEFFRLFNILQARGCRIALSSDRFPHEIGGIQKRLVARFRSGAVVELKPPGLKTRVAIIRRKSKMLGIELPRQATMLLASRIRTNVRRIEGALNRIAAYFRLYGRPPDQEIVDILLHDTVSDGEGDTLTITAVQRKVARHFKISMSSLLGHKRSGDVVFPRQMAMFLCRRLISSPYADIAAAFSGRDHTTAIHAFRAINELLLRSSEARETLDELLTALRS